MMKNASMTQSQSQILSITFLHQLLRLFSKKSSFQTNLSELFYRQKTMNVSYLSILINLVSLITFQLKFYTLFRKRFLNRPCHFKFARNHSESTRWWENCMRNFSRPWKSIWHSGFQRHLKWCNSDYIIIKCGVPWGSVLDPLLFLIFISDFNIAIKHCDTFHFADDTCLLNIQDSRK